MCRCVPSGPSFPSCHIHRFISSRKIAPLINDPFPSSTASIPGCSISFLPLSSSPHPQPADSRSRVCRTTNLPVRARPVSLPLPSPQPSNPLDASRLGEHMQTTSAQHHLALKAVHGQQQGRHRSHSSIHARSSPLNPDDATATLPVPVVGGDVSTACSSSTASPSPSPKPEPPLSSPSPKPQQGDCVASSSVVSLPKNSAGGGDNDSQATPSRTTRTMTHDDDDEDEDESYFDTTTGTDDDDDDVGEDDVPSPGADDDGRTPPSRSGRWGTGGGEDAADDGSRRAGELLLVDDRDVDLSLSDEGESQNISAVGRAPADDSSRARRPAVSPDGQQQWTPIPSRPRWPVFLSILCDSPDDE